MTEWLRWIASSPTSSLPHPALVLISELSFTFFYLRQDKNNIPLIYSKHDPFKINPSICLTNNI